MVNGLILSLLVFASLISPLSVFAEEDVRKECSSWGYTVSTINGVFTDDVGARNNERALMFFLKDSYDGEPIEYRYFLNPSQVYGVGDIIKVVYQKYFEERAVKDYDLANMIKDASEKVKTQKLLLVPHSQGNFYANSFYDSLADQQGGVPRESIAIYGVANPANRVAGNGRYITSSTDQIIAGLVDHAPGQAIIPANTRITEVETEQNPFNTHGFADVYLKYRGGQIVSEIQKSLSELSVDPDRREDVKCFEAPPLTIPNIVEGGTIFAFETTANATIAAVKITAELSYQAGVFVVVSGIKTLSLISDFGGFVAESTIKGGKLVVSGISGAASSVYAATKALLAENSGPVLSENFGANNTASVIGAFTQKAPKNTAVSGENNPVLVRIVVPQNIEKGSVETQISPEETVQAQVSAIQEAPKSAPRLVFVGMSYPGFGGGMPVIQQPLVNTPDMEVLGHEEGVPPAQEIASVALSMPVIDVPQCAYSLALDGCLIATTSVRFVWNEIENASTYNLSLSGVFATTTNNYIDITAPDFSDYIFEISAIGDAGQRSATSTKTISVATIPIAINEIAWMGTQHSTSDEWIELKNNTNHELDLTQWVLQSADGTPYVNLQNTIAPKAFIVLERTNDATVADVMAHGIYTGALNNAGEQLALLYASTTLDTTPLGVWAAGTTTSSTRASMERYSSRNVGSDAANWATNLGYIKNGIDESESEIFGTPGARNSVNYLINKGEDVLADLTLKGEDGAYLIPDILIVGASSTLTLEPGTEVLFFDDDWAHRGELVIFGNLEANGTKEKPIVFDSMTTAKAGDIWIQGTTTASSTFSYAEIRNSKNGISADRGARIDIDNIIFQDSHYGVNAYNGSAVSIRNSQIVNTESDAIGAYDNSTILVASTTIDTVTEGGAIGVYDGSTLKISSSTIRNVDGDGVGVYDSTALIEDLTIEHGQSDGIGVYDSTATITNTTISDLPRGIGVGVFGDSSVDITSTEISHTDTGLMAEQGTVPDPLPESVNSHDNVENIYIF